MQIVEEYDIKIVGLRLYAYHGVYPEENKLGQEFEIDLTLRVSGPSSIDDDDLNQVLSYWKAVATVKDIFTGKTFKLLETAAHKILESLSQYPQIKHARIFLKKLSPPIPVTVKHVGIVMEKTY